MSRAPLAWYRLRWPREVSADQVEAAMRVLASSAGSPIVLEAVGEAGLVTHRLAVPEGRAGAVAHQLRAIVPGLSCEADAGRENMDVDRSVELRTTTKRRPLRTDDPAAVSRSLLTALGQVGRDELLGVQWVLTRPAVPVAVPNRLAFSHT